MFPQYYNSEHLKASSLRERAQSAMPPPDIQLYKILETCQHLNDLHTTILILHSEPNNEVVEQLKLLGYNIQRLTYGGYVITW